MCECVVILKNLKDVSWAGAKSMMTDPGFLKSLVEFDKDGLTEKQVKHVKTEYMKDPSFTYDNIRNISTAGAGTAAQKCVSCCRSAAYTVRVAENVLRAVHSGDAADYCSRELLPP